jgi:hypothetical protein
MLQSLMTGLAKSFNQIHITTRRVIQMTFITKQAGLLRSARSWGVLGLLLALAVLTVGYGQIPVGSLQPVPTPLSLPAGEMVGDILTPYQPDIEGEPLRLAELPVSVNLTGRGEFAGRVIVFQLEPLEAQPDPVNKAIGPEIILAQEPFSNARPSITIKTKSPRPAYIGIVMLIERSPAPVNYTVSTTLRGVAFAVIVEDVKFTLARGGSFTFQAPTEEQLKGTPPSPTATIACQGSVYSFNSSWIQWKTFNHDVCQQLAPVGSVYLTHQIQIQWCKGAIDTWKSQPFNPQHLGIRIRMRNVWPRSSCQVAYIVFRT